MQLFIRFSYTVIFFVSLLCGSALAADTQNELAIEALMGNAKLIDAQELLAPFSEGQDRVRIVVGFKPSAKAASLAENSKKSDNEAQSMFVEGGPLFYDLKNESIKEQLKDTVKESVTDIISTFDSSNITVERTFTYIFGFSGSATLEGITQLVNTPEVMSIEKDLVLVPHLSQGIPLINASSTRSTYDGAGLSIAICDTGIDSSHPRLGGGGSPFNSKVIGGYDFGMVDGDPRPSGSTPNAHGTACAGIAAGNLGSTGDYIGGVAPGSKLYALKISNDFNHQASGSAMASAWDWVVNHQYDDPNNPIMIISTSFGGGRYTTSCNSAYSPMTTAAANAVAAGITIFVSSGNDGYCDAMGWPACISYVNSVGAVYDANIGTPGWCVDSTSCAPKTPNGGCSSGWAAFESSTAADQVTLYSNSASFLTMFASSNNAYTTDIVGLDGYSSGSYTTDFGGTSAACPYAAGAAAVLQSAAKKINGSYLSPSKVKEILVNNGNSITDGKVAITKPRVNLGDAIASIGGGGVQSGLLWYMIQPALMAREPVNPSWGADNNVCCTAGSYTFAISTGGVTKRATNKSCSASTTWEGWQSTTKGTKKFKWSTSGSCTGYSGSFSHKLEMNKRYLFWAKWTGTKIEIWVSIYRVKLPGEEDQFKESEPLDQKLIQVISLDSQVISLDRIGGLAGDKP